MRSIVLRRKLLLILLVVTVLLMSLALTAIWSMRGIHVELEQLAYGDAELAERADLLTMAVSEVEMELHALQVGRKRHLDALIDAVEHMNRLTGELAEAKALATTADLPRQVALFERHVAALSVIRDPDLLAYHHEQGQEAARELRRQILAVNRQLHGQVQTRLADLTRSFRWVVIGVAGGFLLVINVSVLLLLRSAEMIVRPVDELVTASRELAAERFEHRIELPGRDEFHELASAFNHLAQQLQDNERRKVEMMQQVARTLNHELNNAMAIIDLQLQLLRRQAGSEGERARPLEQIHANLQRMTRVVESLKQVRRIVLTDYTEGLKMLDLERSTEPAIEAGEPLVGERTGSA